MHRGITFVTLTFATHHLCHTPNHTWAAALMSTPVASIALHRKGWPPLHKLSCVLDTLPLDWPYIWKPLTNDTQKKNISQVSFNCRIILFLPPTPHRPAIPVKFPWLPALYCSEVSVDLRSLTPNTQSSNPVLNSTLTKDKECILGVNSELKTNRIKTTQRIWTAWRQD